MRKSVLKRITGDKHRKGLGTSRVDVCRSGRRFCFSEFNYEDTRHHPQKKNVNKPLRINQHAEIIRAKKST